MTTPDKHEGSTDVEGITIRLALVALALSMLALEDMVLASPGNDAFITSHAVQGNVIGLAAVVHTAAFAWYLVAGRQPSGSRAAASS